MEGAQAETPGEEAAVQRAITAAAEPEAERDEEKRVALNEQEGDNHADTTEKDNTCKPNDYLLQTLDALEIRVEKMREMARSVKDERSHLLYALNNMMQSEAIDHLSEAEREELGLYIDRLITRCLTVDVTIQTVRTSAQEQSLLKVKGHLEELVTMLRADFERNQQRLTLYLNSCLTGADGEPTSVDERFQGAVLGCAIEDQKAIRRKLQELWDGLSSSEGSVATLQGLSLDL